MGALSDLRKKQKLPNDRQALVLEMLADFSKKDGFRGPWFQGLYGPKPIADRLNLGKQMVKNDLDSLAELGYIEKRFNGTYSVTEKGWKLLNDGNDRDAA